MDLAGKTVIVTGGAGFLGRAVLEALDRRGVGKVVVPRKADYDLVHEEAADRLYRDHDPDVILHLAAEASPATESRPTPYTVTIDPVVGPARGWDRFS